MPGYPMTRYPEKMEREPKMPTRKETKRKDSSRQGTR